MKKSKLEPKQIKTLFILIGLLFTLLLGFFAYYEFSAYLKVKKKIKARQLYLSRLEEDLKNFNSFIKKYEEEKTRFAKLLFKKRDIPAFLEKVSLFAKKSKVKVVSLKTGRFSQVKVKEEEMGSLSKLAKKRLGLKKKEEEKKVVLSYLPINVRIEGNFSSIINFLTFLEGYRQLLTLTDVKIKRKNYPVLDCSFVLKIYSLKE